MLDKSWTEEEKVGYEEESKEELPIIEKLNLNEATKKQQSP